MSDEVVVPPVDEPVTPPVEPTVQPDEEADLDAQLEAQAVVIPGDEKLVPLSAVTNLREKLKATKGEAAKATGLQVEVDRLKAEQEEARPWIEAAKTIAATRQLQQDRPQDRPAEPDPALQAELAEVARDLDLYTADGKPDLDKAKRIHERTQRVATQAATAAVAPSEHQALQQRASAMYQRAILTAAADGSKPDPEILRDVFARVGPQLAATEEGARELWVAAMGRSVAAGRLVAAKAPTKPATEIPPPLLTERAGGKDEPHKAPLSEMERRALKQMGMTEKDYLEADTRPWRR